MSNRNPKSRKRNPKMSRTGKTNGRWKNGRSVSYYRKKAGAKDNDGSIIHHKDGNRKNNKKSNLQKIKPKKGISARGLHNKRHPNRGAGK